jgi:hypothetical protein
MEKLTEKEETILRHIGHFFMDKQFEALKASNEGWEKDKKYLDKVWVETVKDLQRLGVHGIKFYNNLFKKSNQEIAHKEVIVYLERPGLLIGEKGKTIDSLSKYLSDTIKEPIEISVREYCIYDRLIPMSPAECMALGDFDCGEYDCDDENLGNSHYLELLDID